MKKLFLLFLLSLGLISISYATNTADMTNDELCGWKFLPPAHIIAELYKRGHSCDGGEVLVPEPTLVHEFDTTQTIFYSSKYPPQPSNYLSLYNRPDKYGRTFSSSVIPDRWTSLQTPLMDIEIPEDWKLIDDYDRYQEIISRNATPRLLGFSNNPPKSLCMDMLHNFEKFSNMSGGRINFGGCLQDLRARLYEGDRDYVREIFEHWARVGLDQPMDGDIGAKDYTYWVTLNYISGIYAQEKDNIEFSDTFKAWLIDRLLNTQFRSFAINNTIYPRCMQVDFFTWTNDCSGTRLFYTEAQLVGGLALGNKEIFDEGIDSLQYVTTFFDDKNIYPIWAARGIRMPGYYNQIPTWFSHFAVILDTVGYDFMEHEMPNGSKVHEAIKVAFDYVWADDLSIFWPYIQINHGTNGDWTFPELLKPLHKRPKGGSGASGRPAKPQKVVRQSLRYVDEYQPELKDRFGYEEVYSKNVTGTEDFCVRKRCTYSDLSWYAMYHLGSPFDMHSIYKANLD